MNRHFASYVSDIFQEPGSVSLDKSLNLVDQSDKIISFEHMSHGEKNVLEIAYRLDLLDIALQNKTVEEGCLVLETPEEALDLTYREKLGKILSVAKQKRLRLIITTSDYHHTRQAGSLYSVARYWIHVKIQGKDGGFSTDRC